MADIKKHGLLMITSTLPAHTDDSAPRFVLDLATNVATHNCFDVHILAPRNIGARANEDRHRVHIHRFRYFIPQWQTLTRGSILANIKRHKSNVLQVPFFLVAELFSINRIVRKHNIKVLHAHWWFPQGFIAVLSRMVFRLPVKITVTSHGSDMMALRDAFWNRLKRFVFSRSEAITVVSKELLRLIRELGVKSEVFVVPMGVHDELFVSNADHARPWDLSTIPLDTKIVLFVGRLTPEKGMADGLKAFAKLYPKEPKAHLVVIGDGSERDHLERLAKMLNVSERVHFTGGKAHHELPAYYANASLLIVPSVREGFGIVAAEAMLSGKPVVVSKAPAFSDFVTDKKTGFVVDTTNHHDFANVIIKVLSNHESANKVAAAGSALVKERYTWQAVSNTYNALLLKLVGP